MHLLRHKRSHVCELHMLCPVPQQTGITWIACEHSCDKINIQNQVWGEVLFPHSFNKCHSHIKIQSVPTFLMLWSALEPACNMEACFEHSCKTHHLCKWNLAHLHR